MGGGHFVRGLVTCAWATLSLDGLDVTCRPAAVVVVRAPALGGTRYRAPPRNHRQQTGRRPRPHTIYNMLKHTDAIYFILFYIKIIYFIKKIMWGLLLYIYIYMPRYLCSIINSNSNRLCTMFMYACMRHI
jgi:hypothetical protein